MKRIYLLWMVLFASAIQAQQITFRTSYDVASFDLPGSIIQNPSGNYVMAGTNANFIPLYGNVIELDTIGNVVWAKGYSGGSVATDIWDIKNVSTGGYITAGSSGSGLMLTRLNSSGNVTWSNRYHIGSGTDEYASRVIQSSDGGFVVAGYVYGATPPASTAQDSANLFCLKVNSAGTLQWAKTFFVSTAFQNDHVLDDVAEVSDGYIFVGRRSVDGNDDNGSYAVVLKTNTSGALQWFYRYGSSSSEATSVVPLSGTEVMIGGDDNSRAYYLKVTSSGTSNGGNQYNFGFFNVAVPYNTFVTNDGQYAMVGQYLAPLSFTFASYVMKMNASNGNVIFSRGYNSGLSAILPEGTQAQDSGYIAVMTAQQMTGFNYHIVKTDKNGFMNNVNCDTIIVTAPSRSGYTPTLTSATPTEISTISTNSVTVTVANLTPTEVVECLVVPCTQPPTPSAGASPNPICAGASTTISGSGSGSGVTYKVYTAATGGTFLGNAPLVVSPASTTTYYVGAESNSQSGCVSAARGSVTVTVNQPPAVVGTITGAASPCPGSQGYSISAVSGATSYTWSVSGGGTITGGQGTTSITINWTTAGGPYTVSVTATNSCGSTSNTKAVTVQTGPPAAVGAITGNTNPCPGAQTYSISVVANASSYTWSVSGGGTIASGQGTTSISVNWTTSGGPYTVSVTATNSCGSTSNSTSVTVQTAPPAAVGTISGSTTPCPGNQTYSIGAVTNATSYVWSVSGGGSISSGQGTTSININWTTSGGPYTVSVTASNSCGNTSNSITVNVVSTISGVGASASPNPACVGNNVTLSGSGTNATSWSWSGPNSYSSSSQNPSLTNIQTNQAGTYTLTASNACGSATASVNISVNDIPQNISANANPNPACPGNTINLTGVGTNVTSWSWSGPNAFSAATQNAAVTNAQTNASGTYTLTATNTCGNATGTVNVTVNDLPLSVTATANPASVCEGAVLNLSGSATGATSYSWTGPNAFSSTQLNNSITSFQVANAGTYTLTATNACGSNQNSVSVSLSSGPTNATASANLTNICSNSNLTLSGNATGATSYSWSGPNGFSSAQQNPSNGNVTLADSGLYVLIATNICGTATASVNVDVDTVIQNLTVTASPSDTVCAGANINLVANGIQVNTWSWTGPNAFSSTQQNPVIGNSTATNSGTYTVTAGNACGNQSANVVVLVNDPIQSLSASASSNGVVCSGSSITLSATGTNVNSWSWSGPNSFSSAQQNPAINLATTIDNGTYTVTAYNACGNQTASVAVQIDTTIENLSASSLPNDTLCVGDTINLSASGANVTSWNWTGPNGYSSSQQNPFIANSAVSNSGTYILTGTNTCGSVSDSVSVLVNTVPPYLGPIRGNIWSCANTLGTYYIFPVANADSYLWTLSGGGTIISGQGTDTIRIQWGNVAGSDTIRVVVSNNCGISTQVLPVNLYPPPPIMTTEITGDSVLCQNGLGRYRIDTVANALNYMWFSDSTFVNANGWIYAEAYFDSPGVFKVYAYAVGACGNSDTISFDVLVHPLPAEPSITITNSPICRGDTVTITGFSTDTNVTLSVFTTYPPGGNYLGPSPYSFNTTFSTNNYPYFVTASNQYGCMNSSTTVSYTFIQQPTGLYGTGDTICFDNSATLGASYYPPTLPSTITWWDSPTGGTQLDTGNIFITPNLTQNTTYYISTNTDGCQNIAPRVPVTAYIEQPISPFGIGDTICFNNSASLEAFISPASGNTTITWWDSPSGGTQVDSGNIFITPNLTQTTTYYISTNTNGCQSFASRVPVTAFVFGQTTVILTTDHENNTILQNEVLTFTALPDSFANYEFFWNGTSVQSGELNTWASSKLNDLDSVWVIAISNGCESARSEVLVHVMDFPNAFTPNSDGTNDVFLKNYDLVIVNRWGQELYTGRDGWDGKYKGDKVSPGTYYYIVTLDNITDRKSAIKGTVLLIED